MEAALVCTCKYKNPIEYVCTSSKCKENKLICQSCAWNHRQHERAVKLLTQWKDEITNDCVLQRLESINTNQTQMHCLDEFAKIAQGELVLAIKSLTDKFKQKLLQVARPYDKLIDALKQLSQNKANENIVKLIIQQFPDNDIHQQIDEGEIQMFSQTKQTCNQILLFMNKICDLLSYCEQQPSGDLSKLKKQLNDCVKKADLPFPKKLLTESTYIQRKSQQQNLNEDEKDDKLNDFFSKLKHNHRGSEFQASKLINYQMSLSNLNYQKPDLGQLKSERQSYYIASKGDDDFIRNQFIQPLSTKSNPYNNVFQMSNEKKDVKQDYRQDFKQDFKQEQKSEQTFKKQVQKPLPNESLQQFYLQKVSNSKKNNEDFNEQISKSFYEYPSNKRY